MGETLTRYKCESVTGGSGGSKMADWIGSRVSALWQFIQEAEEFPNSPCPNICSPKYCETKMRGTQREME